MMNHGCTGRRLLLAWAAGAMLAVAIPAGAQTATPPVTVPAVSLVLPNYNSVPVGEVGALEGGAFVARANDASAGFYNPAGLAHAEQSSISGSSGTYQFGSVSPEALTNVTGTFTHIPAMFGVLVKNLMGRPNWAAGFTVTRSAAWSQAVDAEAVSTVAGGPINRLRFSTDASFDSWVASLGVAYSYTDRLRFGGTLDGQYTSVYRRQSVTSQSLSASGLTAVDVGSLGNASLYHLRATLGAQFRLTPSVQVGAVLRTPGLGLFPSGDASLEGLAHAGTATGATAFFDPEASASLRLPFEFKAGAAWIGTRAQVEFDLFTYAGTGQYTAIESPGTVRVVLDRGQGGAPTVTEMPYQGPRVDSRGVVNVAIGGRYQLTDDRTWALHGGYATDRSPVGDADTTYSKVHLQHLTIGVSGRTTMFLGSLGFRYSAGHTDTVELGPTAAGGPVYTMFNVSSIGLVYSLSLLF